MKHQRKAQRRGFSILAPLLWIIILLLLMFGLLYLWDMAATHWGMDGKITVATVTPFLFAYILTLRWGYKNNRLITSLGTGQAIAVCYGSSTGGEITHFVITRGDRRRVLRLRNDMEVRIKNIRAKRRRERALRDLARFDLFMKEKVKIARGFLRLFGLIWISRWNWTKTLHGIDQGVTKEINPKTGKLDIITHFQWIDTPNTLLKGIDVSGSKKKGTYQIDVIFRISDLFFWDFDKVYAQKDSTAEQKKDQLLASANRLCRGHTSDAIEEQQFSEDRKTDVYAGLLAFGMLGREVETSDINLTGSPEALKAERDLALAETIAETRRIEAAGKADAYVIEKTGVATGITKIGDAKAGAAGKLVAEALRLPDVNAQRVVLGGNNPLAAVPTDVRVLTLGSGKNAPEVWIDGDKEDEEEPEPLVTP